MSPRDEAGTRESTLNSHFFEDCAAMVLAAGLGTRLTPFTNRNPKPLLPFFDVPVIEYTIRGLARLGIRTIVVNLHHKAGRLEEELEALGAVLSADSMERGCGPISVRFSHERELMGTGGGIALARHCFEGKRLLVTNSDIFHTFPLQELMACHLQAGSLATVLLHDGKGVERLRSTEVDSEGRIRLIGRADTRFTNRCVFTGVYLLEPEVYLGLPSTPCSVIEEGLHPLLDKGLVSGLKRSFVWHDLGTWQAYHSACRSVLDEGLNSGRHADYRAVFDLAPGRFVLQRGAPSHDASVEPPGYVGPEVRLDPLSRIGPYCVLGSASRVGPAGSLSDCVLLEADINRTAAGEIAGNGWSVVL